MKRIIAVMSLMIFVMLITVPVFCAAGAAQPAVSAEAQKDAHKTEVYRAKLEAFKNNKTPALLFGVLSLIFLYGILHGLSLAHGGSVISAWVLSSRQKLKNVVTASVLTGYFHAFSATIVVFTTWFVLQGVIAHDKLQMYIKDVAGVIILSTGVYSIYNFITAKIKGTCTHCHGHGHEEEHMNPVTMAFMAGMMPCPVTSVILITALGLGMPLHGLLFMIVFATGMALAILGIAAAIWFMKERAEGLKLKKVSEAIENILPVFGAILFIVIGIVLLTASEL